MPTKIKVIKCFHPEASDLQLRTLTTYQITRWYNQIVYMHGKDNVRKIIAEEYANGQ
jgi:hypothetical protein